MRVLLDASALLPYVTRRGAKLLKDASTENLCTRDLAVYEACNSLWKMVYLLKTISSEDASDTATVLKNITSKGLIQTMSFESLDLSRVLERACEENTSFYDASYLISAEDERAILVTEDKKLRRIADKTIKTLTYEDFEKELDKDPYSQ